MFLDGFLRLVVNLIDTPWSQNSFFVLWKSVFRVKSLRKKTGQKLGPVKSSDRKQVLILGEAKKAVASGLPFESFALYFCVVLLKSLRNTLEPHLIKL